MTTSEYKEILNVFFFEQKKDIDLEYISEIFESCKYWDNKIIGINHFLSLSIENLEKRFDISPELIDSIYSLEDQMNYKIQEVDYEFIRGLFETYDLGGLTIEEKMIEIQRGIDE